MPKISERDIEIIAKEKFVNIIEMIKNKTCDTIRTLKSMFS
jgi:hypothetical protein